MHYKGLYMVIVGYRYLLTVLSNCSQNIIMIAVWYSIVTMHVTKIKLCQNEKLLTCSVTHVTIVSRT